MLLLSMAGGSSGGAVTGGGGGGGARGGGRRVGAAPAGRPVELAALPAPSPGDPGAPRARFSVARPRPALAARGGAGAGRPALSCLRVTGGGVGQGGAHT